MSKIFILVEPVEGHFNPFIPIISRLVERGHELVCVTGKRFKYKVEDLEAVFHPLPERWDILDHELYDRFPALKTLKGLAQVKFYIKNIMYAQIPDTIDTLTRLLQNFPADVVIGDSFMLAGAWLTEMGGPPNVRLSILPLSLPDKDLPPFGLGWLPGTNPFLKFRDNLLNRLFEKLLFSDVQQDINDLRQQLGLPAYDKYFFTKSLEIPNRVLHTSTPLFEYSRAAFPANFRFIGPIAAVPQHNFVEPGWWSKIQNKQQVPVILINQGTIAKAHEDLILPAIAALQDLPVIVVAVPVDASTLKRIPENTHCEKYIPFGNLLPYVNIMISNGGFGGTQQALAHGIPLIIAGATEDKMEVAARVKYSGAGINLRKQKLTPDVIKQAVLKILADPAYKQNAVKLQMDFSRYDGVSLSVTYIEELIDSHISHRSVNPRSKVVLDKAMGLST